VSENPEEPVDEGTDSPEMESPAVSTPEPEAAAADAPSPSDAGAEEPDPPADIAPAPAAPAAKADVGRRIVAILIDFGLAFILSVVIPAVGGLLAAAYMVARDGLDLDFMHHRSIGKHLMKLSLVNVDGQPHDLMTSVRRNWMFGLGPIVSLLLFIPILGWVLIPFVVFAAIALIITEFILALTDAEGRRLGDKWSGTMLVED
jgi:hypothetical protein